MRIVLDHARGLAHSAAVRAAAVAISAAFTSCALFNLFGGKSPSAGTQVFYNNGNGVLTPGPFLQGTSNSAVTVTSGYDSLAIGNIASHSTPSDGGSAVKDLFVTNDNVGQNQVWKNSGDGTFTQVSESKVLNADYMAVAVGRLR